MLEGNRSFFAKKYGKAITSYENGIEIAPEDVDAWNNRGLCNLPVGKGESSYREFR